MDFGHSLVILEDEEDVLFVFLLLFEFFVILAFLCSTEEVELAATEKMNSICLMLAALEVSETEMMNRCRCFDDDAFSFFFFWCFDERQL